LKTIKIIKSKIDIQDKATI